MKTSINSTCDRMLLTDTNGETKEESMHMSHPSGPVGRTLLMTAKVGCAAVSTSLDVFVTSSVFSAGLGVPKDNGQLEAFHVGVNRMSMHHGHCWLMEQKSAPSISDLDGNYRGCIVQHMALSGDNLSPKMALIFFDAERGCTFRDQCGRFLCTPPIV